MAALRPIVAKQCTGFVSKMPPPPEQEGNGPVVRAGRQWRLWRPWIVLEVKSDFKFELTDLNNLYSHVSMAPTCHYLFI